MTANRLGKALTVGALTLWPPVILAPMAGVTNYPFRRLCQRYGAALTVSEMVTVRPLVESNAKTLRIARFGADESIRSLQLYGIDPYYMAEATKRLVAENAVDHIDMNFGCPVKKVTAKGGGAALPYHQKLFAKLIAAVVNNADTIPVTVKFRMGIDDEHLTYLPAGKIAEQQGAAAIGLHARTAAQMYSGKANWQAIAELKTQVRTIPVLGNGDVFSAADAAAMMQATACDGVIIGRGCLGKPWLFAEIKEFFSSGKQLPPFSFQQVAAVMLEHAQQLCVWLGEQAAMRDFRKHSSWYVKAFRTASKIRERLMRVNSLAELRQQLAAVDPQLMPLPEQEFVSRGRKGRAQKVALPQGYLENPESVTIVEADYSSTVAGG